MKNKFNPLNYIDNKKKKIKQTNKTQYVKHKGPAVLRLMSMGNNPVIL